MRKFPGKSWTSAVLIVLLVVLIGVALALDNPLAEGQWQVVASMGLLVFAGGLIASDNVYVGMSLGFVGLVLMYT